LARRQVQGHEKTTSVCRSFTAQATPGKPGTLSAVAAIAFFT
jgi:hypothetical protein